MAKFFKNHAVAYSTCSGYRVQYQSLYITTSTKLPCLQIVLQPVERYSFHHLYIRLKIGRKLRMQELRLLSCTPAVVIVVIGMLETVILVSRLTVVLVAVAVRELQSQKVLWVSTGRGMVLLALVQSGSQIGKGLGKGRRG